MLSSLYDLYFTLLYCSSMHFHRDAFKQMITPSAHRPPPRNMSLSSMESAASSTATTESNSQHHPFAVSEADQAKHLDKTLFHLRIAEIARENSFEGASLVVMTLPLPKMDVPCPLYLAWLDFITRNMPPFLLVRGNQESVLTFYS